MAQSPNEIAKIIVYVGSDSSYWTTIQGRYVNGYPETKFEFKKIEPKEIEKSYQQIFLQIYGLKPAIIYIDLSKERDYLMRLATMLGRENTTRTCPIVGLVDSKEILKECIAAKVTFIHVKCGEYHDVIYDPMRLAFPKIAKKPDFALAKFNREVEIVDDFRLGYICPTYVHIEGNCYFEKGQAVEIETEISRSVVPSKKYIVKEVHTSNLYYDYRYGFDLEFKFVDEPEAEPAPEAEEGDSDAIANLKKNDLSEKQKKAIYEGELAQTKKKVRKWVVGNIDPDNEKKTKILVVDQTLSVLRNSAKALDQYGYAIRCQSILTEDLSELDVLRPNIISYQLKEFRENESNDLNEEQIQEKKDEESASLNTLSEIISKIKAFDKYNPFIILFNCTKYTSKSFQDSFKYPLVLTNKETMSLEMVLEMANLYEAKQEKKTNQLIENKIKVLKKENPTKYARLTKEDFKENRYFIKKTNPISHGSTRYTVNIITMSESEMMFETEAALEMGTYRLSFPTDMSITVIPEKDTGRLFQEIQGKRIYEALIHGIGEADKKKLRQYVNEIFFSDLNAQREKEDEEYAELTKQKAAEKQEAEKQAADAAEPNEVPVEEVESGEANPERSDGPEVE